MEAKTDPRVSKITALLHNWLETRISVENLSWLKGKQAEIRQKAAEKTLFTAFSGVSRYLEPKKLELSPEELSAASLIVPGWNPINWTVEQVGRTWLILSFPHEEQSRYRATLDKIWAAADVGEAIALYQSLPLLPHPEKFQLRAAEGIRSNMTSVFNAVALNNPYPATYLDDLAWNQMVLKALFIGSPLHPIYGLERRNNEQLSQMLIDYARERLAAKRKVNPELWKLAAPFQPEAVASLEPQFSNL
ncbi:EboA family metabolite traffic protein [Pleurocapsales cyanobacterium LEGE 10410]|nr:EboA family metabolite traffic protein [Pleurocapsales cyanobacterium LEGE 10410]